MSAQRFAVNDAVCVAVWSGRFPARNDVSVTAQIREIRGEWCDVVTDDGRLLRDVRLSALAARREA